MHRPRDEDTVLLSALEKILVSILTLLHPLFDHLELESALALFFIVPLLWLTRNKRFSLISLFAALVLLPLRSSYTTSTLSAVPAFNPANPPGLPYKLQRLVAQDGWFKDKRDGSIVLLRGINFGGSSKTPKNEPSHLKSTSFYSQRANTTFVSRPCPLEQADEHFARLQAWGFNVLRLLVTWEALEHEAPGVYDLEYVQYMVQLVRKANQHNLAVFIDPHQDVWSRWTGGDGAPAWTLEKVGFNVSSALHETGAAWTHQEHGHPFPKMVWATNYARLATATMFTLFFGGDVYAPRTLVGSVSAQEYLQTHYINAIRQLARALKHEENVIGFDTLNEPSNGYIGLSDLRASVFPVPMGYHVGAFDGMVLGAGTGRKIDFFSPPFVYKKTEHMNPNGVSAWSSPDMDVWRQNGVWDFDSKGIPKLLRPKHFKTPSKEYFMEKHMVPFFAKFAQAIREEMGPDVLVFAEPHIEPREPVHHHAPIKALTNATSAIQRFAWAPHFYDGGTLISKSFRAWYALDAENKMLVFGSHFAEKVFTRAAESLMRCGEGLPVVVGETGVPFDMGDSFKTGDFTSQAKALNRVLRAFEAKFLSWTLWTYVYDNTNEHGDNWNGEDLSLWSKDQVTDPQDLNSGGRALQAAVRPYPIKIAGVPLESDFDPFHPRRRFFLKIRVSVEQAKTQKLETIIFVPKIHYPNGVEYILGGGEGVSSSLVLSENNEQGAFWNHNVVASSSSAAQFVDQWIELLAK